MPLRVEARPALRAVMAGSPPEASGAAAWERCNSVTWSSESGSTYGLRRPIAVCSIGLSRIRYSLSRMRSSAATVRRNSSSSRSNSARSPPSSRTYIRAIAMSAFAQTISNLPSRSSKNGQAVQHPEPTGLGGDRFERGPHAQPSRQHESRLGPPEHPGDRPDLLDRLLPGTPVSRPRSEPDVGELPHGSRLEKQLEQVSAAVHQRAIRW